MPRWGKICPTLRRRFTAIATLFVFVVGNIGWPVVPQKPAKAATSTHARLAEGKTCCCGHKGDDCSCGCCKRPLATRSPGKAGCCQKKKTSTTLAFNCPCGGSESAGFVVSSQPKLAARAVAAPQLVETFAVSPTSSLRVPEGNLCPDTPPPRPSLC
jgi:hypothetical protein